MVAHGGWGYLFRLGQQSFLRLNNPHNRPRLMFQEEVPRAFDYR